MSPSNYQNVKAYHRASHTVAKTRQVVMLYDGMIRFLKQARDCMESRDIEGRYNKLIKAGEIIMGLQSSLDFDNGGDAARVLYGFYSTIDMRIISLHRTNDIADCDRIIADLKEMRDVWNRIDRGLPEKDAAPEVADEQEVPPQPPEEPVTISA
ncbi:MAG: flagellar export chaperone FliS [Alphaproteobacteria bacterium]|nr:flagellar export chaperone FliS [Alphaproteobacteria bacterium]